MNQRKPEHQKKQKKKKPSSPMNQSIKTLVNKRIKKKIQEAQKKYDEECVQIDERAEREKEKYAYDLVDEIVPS